MRTSLGALTDFGDDLPSESLCCELCDSDPTCQGWTFFTPQFGFLGVFCNFYNDKSLALETWVKEEQGVLTSACSTQCNTR